MRHGTFAAKIFCCKDKVKSVSPLDYYQECLPGGAVTLLCGVEGFAVISNDYLLAILNLRQCGPPHCD